MNKKTFLLHNGTVVTGGKVCKVITDGGIVWQGERIIEIGNSQDMRVKYKDAKIINAKGGMIFPGFINLHHHYYSALARGLNPGRQMNNFSEVLQHLWWRLDRALGRETVKISADLTAADCIRSGCTTVFDHHASPSFIEGSLELMAESLSEAGLSGTLCYETSDRNGSDEAKTGIEENIRFIKASKTNPRIKGLMGLHASFTVSDNTLASVSEKLGNDKNCHIHMAEDKVDIEASLKEYGLNPLGRLEKFGLLGPKTILAHGIHLSAEHLKKVAARNSIIVHNPESNANNGVGRLDVARAFGLGCTLGLGTDGMTSSMLQTLRFTFLTERGEARNPTLGFNVFPDLLLKNNALIARRFFDEPLWGELAVNSPADIAVVDCPVPTPISAENVFGHLVYGAANYPVRHTVAFGKILFQDYEFLTLDQEKIAKEARRIAPEFWREFAGK